MTTVHKIENLEDKRIIHTWNRLNESAGSPHIHLTFEWISLWWKYFKKDRELTLFAAVDDNRVVALAPLCTRNVGRGMSKFRILEFLGTGLSDRGDFLWEPCRKDALNDILGHIHAQKDKWDRISLRGFPDWSGSALTLETEAKRLGWRLFSADREGSPYLKIDGDWEAYFKRRSKNLRNDTRRRRNRLADFGNPHIKLLNSPKEIVSVLDKVIKIGIQNPLKRHLFIHPAVRPFLVEMLTLFHDKDWLRFWIMESDGELMSYIMGFFYNKTFYYWNLGYDPQFISCSPGRLLLIDVLKNCFNEKILEFDFMRGEEKYKQNWATGVRHNVKLEIYHSHWRSWLANFLSQGKRHLNSSGDFRKSS